VKQFVVGFLTATVLVGGAGLWVAKNTDNRVRWPVASFYDDNDPRPDSGYIRAQGSLIGEDMTGTTFLDVRCVASERTCRINELSNFGPYRQVMLWDDEYPITL
jgi:hypothetical protein